MTYSAEGYLPKTIVTTITDGEKTVQNVQLTSSVGIAEYEERIVVYPNPAQDHLTVELSDGMEFDHLALYDIQGRLVETKNYASLQQPITIKLDIRNLPSGIYVLHIRKTNGREIIQKVQVL